jgi:hypothetical protein
VRAPDSEDGARRGRGGRPPQGAARRVGARGQTRSLAGKDLAGDDLRTPPGSIGSIEMTSAIVAATTPGFVPESVIVFLLKHSAAFEWVCINCQCGADLECISPGGKWQQSQGETGLDIVGRMATPRHRWFSGLGSAATMVLLEAKGDRLKQGGKINKPAYNEMTGALAGFFLSNLGRIRDHEDRVYGWLVPATFHERVIQDFREARANLPLALPTGRDFLIGTFDGARFWREAPAELHCLARDWFGSKEDGRNTLCRERLACLMPEVQELAEALFRFEIVSGPRR